MKPVTGPVETAQLGRVLMHEHIITRSPGVIENWPDAWDREAVKRQAIEKLKDVQRRGIDTLVDLTTVDLGRDVAFVREIAAAAPYEFIEIVVNDRKYGGGGIHNLYATVSADNASTPYVFVHEFGHHFAGLADEYYTSDVAYETGTVRPEPWEPNVTADQKASKWNDLARGAKHWVSGPDEAARAIGESNNA